MTSRIITQQLCLNKFSKAEKGVGAKRRSKTISVKRLGKVDHPDMKAKWSPSLPSWSVSKKSTCC